MIQFNSINSFKSIYYNGQEIKYVYDYQGKVWGDGSPVPPTPTGDTKFIGEWNNGTSYSAVCDGDATLTSATTRPEGYTLYGMTSATIGDCITSIGDYTFQQCYNLSSVTIPSSVTSIGNYSFQYCTSLTSFTFSNTVENIGHHALRGCTNLASITVDRVIPPSLGSSAFENTNNCPIYVPSESVETYKRKIFWTTYADRIQAIPNS